jgi:hypothetical protein
VDHLTAEAGIDRVSVLEDMRALYGGDDEQGPDWESTHEALQSRITILSDRAWEGRVKWDLVERWLANFTGDSGLTSKEEQVHALYLLSQFLYFGSREIRVLLRALFRDLFLLPLIQEVRAKNGGIREPTQLRILTQEALKNTRFLGVGNPSESGVHLLYFFRQENGLKKHHFLDTAQILERVRCPNQSDHLQLRHPDVERYIFVDDVCGSGETAVRYSKDFLEEVKNLNPNVILSYLSIFSTEEGMKTVRDDSIFGNASSAVYELDATYRCLSAESRYLTVIPQNISADTIRKMGLHYGSMLWPAHPGGFLGNQLLLGFHHNTPDNTVPIMWMDESHGAPVSWTPVFRRYPKV